MRDNRVSVLNMRKSSFFEHIRVSLVLLLMMALFFGVTEGVEEEELIRADEQCISCMFCHGAGGTGGG